MAGATRQLLTGRELYIRRDTIFHVDCRVGPVHKVCMQKRADGITPTKKIWLSTDLYYTGLPRVVPTPHYSQDRVKSRFPKQS